MAYIRTKMRHYNGNAWDTVYLQTEAQLVLRSNGTTVESSLNAVEENIDIINNNIGVIEDDVDYIRNYVWYEDLP